MKDYSVKDNYYCYENSFVLRNKFEIKDQKILDSWDLVFSLTVLLSSNRWNGVLGFSDSFFIVLSLSFFTLFFSLKLGMKSYLVSLLCCKSRWANIPLLHSYIWNILPIFLPYRPDNPQHFHNITSWIGSYFFFGPLLFFEFFWVSLSWNRYLFLYLSNLFTAVALFTFVNSQYFEIISDFSFLLDFKYFSIKP